MDIRAAEISDIIRKQIENYDKKVSVTETGTVLTAGDGIARVYGRSGALAGERPEVAGAGGGRGAGTGAGAAIARGYGLSGAPAGALREFEGAGGETVAGMVLNIEEDNVG